MQKTVILGSGGHAKVVVELLRSAGVYEPVGCVGPPTESSDCIAGVPWLGDDGCLPELLRDGIGCAFVGLGDNALRHRLMTHVIQLGFELASAISCSASISAAARLGRGIAVMPQANIGPDATLDDGVIVNSGASVDHDGILGKCSHLGPGATLAGFVRLGHQAFVATGASVIPNIQVGDRSVIGAGSVVVRDIPPDVIAFGTPARVRRTLERTGTDDPHPSNAEPTDDVPFPTFRLVV